jgi:hypothetical protein
MARDLGVLSEDWKWLVNLDQFTLLEISPFGDLFMRDSTGAYCLLDVNCGELEYSKKAGNDPALLFPIAFDMKIATD